jgi:ABC-type multidrug transport system ATPase subunit
MATLRLVAQHLRAPAAEGRRLVKLYGVVPALVEVDPRVDAGSVCAVVGPNGAGKTTLLRILATLVRPTSGRASVFGLEGAVDDEGRALVDELVRDAVAQGRAAIVATHAHERIAGLADQVVELQRGVAVGTDASLVKS